MENFIKEKWIEALRSGRYEQGKNYLKYKTENGITRYCCLGVLCEVMELKSREFIPIDNKGEIKIPFSYRKDDKIMTDTVMLQKDLLTEVGMNIEQMKYLAIMNDSLNNSFSEIASHIEEKIL